MRASRTSTGVFGSVEAQAPGKLVWLGEYAVLDGAPALVMAVDRYARVRLDPRSDTRVVVHAANLPLAPLRGRLADGAVSFDPAVPQWRAAMALIEHCATSLARGFEARIDTSDLYSDTGKLGLGSSAASLVALASAFAASRRAPAPGGTQRLASLRPGRARQRHRSGGEPHRWRPDLSAGEPRAVVPAARAALARAMERTPGIDRRAPGPSGPLA